ncbi:MAG TPA: hypothetical protein P5076_25675, partial [Myxococcota bacterium]|nr:hypothetical protein [Myxococcota bacterium]
MNVFNILAIVATFGVGFFLRLRLKKDIPAFLAACGVLPVWILFAEFALPYQGGGASFWPIAVVYGLVVGSLVGGLGVFLGRLWSGERTAAKKRVDPENPPPLALGAAEVEID